MRIATEVKSLAKILYRATRSLDASGKIEISAIIASRVAATSASPLVCDPETAREKRRRNGKLGAMRADKLIKAILPQTQASACNL
jgi:hypothetical protein